MRASIVRCAGATCFAAGVTLSAMRRTLDSTTGRMLIPALVCTGLLVPLSAQSLKNPPKSSSQAETVVPDLRARILDGPVRKASLTFRESTVTLQVKGEAPEEFEYDALILRRGHHHISRMYPAGLKWYSIIYSALSAIGGALEAPALAAAGVGIYVGIPNAIYFAVARPWKNRWLNLQSTEAQNRYAFVRLPRGGRARQSLIEEFSSRLGGKLRIPPDLRDRSTDGSTKEPLIAAVGSSAPEFALADLDGNHHRVSDFRGRTLLLNFWATWCGPCRKDLPSLQRLQEKHRESDLAVMTVIDGSPEQAKSLLDARQVDYPTLLDEGSSTFSSYGVMEVPTTIVIDQNGVIVSKVSAPGVLHHADISDALKAHLRR